MRCPTCGKPAATDTVYSTCMSIQEFTDESGAHVHDPNRKARWYKCSGGHTWSGDVFFVPCRCGWTAE